MEPTKQIRDYFKEKEPARARKILELGSSAQKGGREGKTAIATLIGILHNREYETDSSNAAASLFSAVISDETEPGQKNIILASLTKALAEKDFSQIVKSRILRNMTHVGERPDLAEQITSQIRIPEIQSELKKDPLTYVNTLNSLAKLGVGIPRDTEEYVSSYKEGREAIKKVIRNKDLMGYERDSALELLKNYLVTNPELSGKNEKERIDEREKINEIKRDIANLMIETAKRGPVDVACQAYDLLKSHKIYIRGEKEVIGNFEDYLKNEYDEEYAEKDPKEYLKRRFDPNVAARIIVPIAQVRKKDALDLFEKIIDKEREKSVVHPELFGALMNAVAHIWSDLAPEETPRMMDSARAAVSAIKENREK